MASAPPSLLKALELDVKLIAADKLLTELRDAASTKDIAELMGLLEHRFGERERAINDFVADWEAAADARRNGQDVTAAVAGLEELIVDSFKDRFVQRILSKVMVAPLKG